MSPNLVSNKSLQLSYVSLVITTVITVSTVPVRTRAAFNAETHPLSQLHNLRTLIQRIRVVGAFQSARQRRLTRSETSRRLSIVSVPEVRADLRRRSTIAPSLPVPRRRSPILKLWYRMSQQPCFRGFVPLITISIAQWLLAFTTDFLLSGHPSDLKFGYGSTSLVLKTVFASAYAVWTHYCITKPSNKRVFDHFPKGGQILIDLWPMTALWGVSEHLCLSGPLALSRTWGLRTYAFDAASWNELNSTQLRVVLGKFALVALLYALLTALVAIPTTMITRRVYASLLSDEDLAIVPLLRGKSHSTNPFSKRSEIKTAPGLSAGEAFGSITWRQYARVLGVYAQYFLLNQIVMFAYWWINWKLHLRLGVHDYAETRLPWSPIGVLRGLGEGKLPAMGDEGRSEL